MMRSPLLKVLGYVAWTLTSLAAIYLGLVAAFGYDVFTEMPALASIAKPFFYLAGVAGVYSLIMLVVSLANGSCCSCGSCK